MVPSIMETAFKNGYGTFSSDFGSRQCFLDRNCFVGQSSPFNSVKPFVRNRDQKLLNYYVSNLENNQSLPSLRSRLTHTILLYFS